MTDVPSARKVTTWRWTCLDCLQRGKVTHDDLAHATRRARVAHDLRKDACSGVGNEGPRLSLDVKPDDEPQLKVPYAPDDHPWRVLRYQTMKPKKAKRWKRAGRSTG